jgi:diaminohydroxyphosphoribosylaminopyrimidine deaminase/5-amino-6-(5-phosphoribosylamino)uracil reductase
VAERAHLSPGTPHAEALALADAGERARGGTVVVTLEPCDHQGRTPPCTEAIIDARVARVVVGAEDPDPRVAGRGITRLRYAGIEVLTGIGRPAVVASDPGYFHHRRTGRPRITVKLAATLDGQVAASDGTSQWITGPVAREDVHRIRAASDAVGVGAGTLLTDDPGLTVRLDGYSGPQPQPVIFGGRRALPASARVFGRGPLVYVPSSRHQPEVDHVVEMPGRFGVDLDGAVKDLGVRGIVDLLIEGGPTLAAGFAAADLVDEYVLYLGGKLALGAGRPLFDAPFTTLADARDVTIVDVTPLGDDVRIRVVPDRRGR